VLLLVDNIFSVLSAVGAEVSGPIAMPSRLGYQPTMAPSCRFEERIANTDNGAITFDSGRVCAGR
jgi:F0F1-type ATP synthase beta subunit